MLRNFMEFLGQKTRWLIALAIFWVVWFNFPTFVIGMYDVNLLVLKAAAKGISFLPYGSAADGVVQLLDRWVALVKGVTGFFKSYGGDRTELIFRTLAFEGLVLWYETKLLVRLMPTAATRWKRLNLRPAYR